MRNYLAFVCGEFHFFIDQDMVQKVVGLPDTMLSEPVIFHDDREIEVVDIKQELGILDTPSRHQIIISCPGSHGPVFKILRVDEVRSICQIPDEQFSPLPFLNEKLLDMIDASFFFREENRNGLRINPAYFNANAGGWFQKKFIRLPGSS